MSRDVRSRLHPAVMMFSQFNHVSKNSVIELSLSYKCFLGFKYEVGIIPFSKAEKRDGVG